MAGIFKAYDIRGVYPDELNEDMGRRIGNAFVQFLDAKKIALGRDMRAHSPSIRDAVVEGVTEAGCDVIDIGHATTPLVYFATGFLEVDGSLQVTASHNPGKYNGFKLSREKAIPLSNETGIEVLEQKVGAGEYVKADKKGSVTERDVSEDYLGHIASFAENIKPMKFVVDCGNGAVGWFIERLYEKLPCEMIGLYIEPDGTFPNHEANPLKLDTLVDLQNRVRETGAAAGIAFDGDGDRCAFVDENGSVIPSDLLTAVMAENLLPGHPGSAVVYDLRSSWVVSETIKEHGGVPLRERVGHAFMKRTLRKHDGFFGGELSGHYYFRDNYYADSGLLAMVTVLNILSRHDKPLSELVTPMKKYSATGEINFEVEDKAGKMKELAETYKDGEIDYVDGITVQFPDWWFNVRPSNTEPLLRLNLEARTKETMVGKKAELVAGIGKPV
ncbi:MAG: phosphomannomutase/phosphoglucomutase [Planctomycetota bacterium]|jgi:phosphomannomutase